MYGVRVLTSNSPRSDKPQPNIICHLVKLYQSVPSSLMLERFRRHLTQSGLIQDGARVLVGYSGGADSTALLHLLKQCEVGIVAAHLHHGQRPEAEEELAKCQAFAETLDIPFLAGRADVPRMAAELGIGLEEAGREARYGFFSEASFRTECDLIATAHTQTDQVETILLNIARGCGLHGLIGIPERRDNIVRLLLPFSREETQGYCNAHGLWTHDDPANTDLAFSRARFRNRIIPELKIVNPGLDAAVLRLSSNAEDEDRFLNGMAAAALEQAEIPLNGELRFLTDDVEMRFDRSKLAHLPLVLRKRAVRLATEALGAPLSFEQTQIAALGLSETKTASVTAEKGEVVVEWGADAVDIRKLAPATPFRYGITVPGETLSEEFGWQFTAFESEADGTVPQRASLNTVFDYAKVKGPLYFRTTKSGDAMQPLGFNGRRKLSDLLSEAKLTQAARARLPIVCDMIGPIWAPGVCVDERTRPNVSSTRLILMRFSTLKA